MRARATALMTLSTALWVASSPAAAQLTGGRIGGSNWGAARPSRTVQARPSVMPSFGAPTPRPAPAPAPTVQLPGLPAVAPNPAAMPGIAVVTPRVEVPAAPLPRLAVSAYVAPPPHPGYVLYAPGGRTLEPDEAQATHPLWPMHDTYGPLNLLGGAVVFVGLFGALGVGAWVLTRAQGAAPSPSPPSIPHAPAGLPVSLGRVSLAFDASLRAHLQAELARFAAQASSSSPEALERTTRQAIDLLGSALGAARAAAVASAQSRVDEAERRFTGLADSLRQRYTVESITEARRVVMPGLSPLADEGQGFVVVSLLVAVETPDLEAPAELNTVQLGAWLRALRPRAGGLLATELIWSPADPGDLMSSAEMLHLYPELRPLEGATLGRVVCGHCRAVFAAELGRCQRCGAAPAQA